MLTPELPLELLNEPFAYKREDTGYRAEILISRPTFLFIIEQEEVCVYIGGKRVASEVTFVREEKIPFKCTSNVSILTVFDTYGLDIALLFLNYVCEKKMKFGYEEWLEVYLEGCYTALLTGIVSRTFDGSYLERIADMKLTIEQELKKRPSSAQLDPVALPFTHALPLEVVAMITNSYRISKVVTELVRTLRGSIVPSIEEVQGWSSMSSTFYALCNYRSVIVREKYVCDMIDVGFHLTHLCGRVATEEVSYPCLSLSPRATSLYNYYHYYVGRGCNGKKSISLLLDWLDTRANALETSELCAWIVQLCCDSRTIIKTDIRREELPHYLRSLVQSCRRIKF